MKARAEQSRSDEGFETLAWIISQRGEKKRRLEEGI